MKIFFYTSLLSILPTGIVCAEPQSAMSTQSLFEILKFAPFFVIFYYFLVHQPKKKQKEHQTALNAMRKGDKVLTSGGIFGVIHKIDANTNDVTLEIAENVRIQVLKSAIVSTDSKVGTIVELNKARSTQ